MSDSIDDQVVALLRAAASGPAPHAPPGDFRTIASWVGPYQTPAWRAVYAFDNGDWYFRYMTVLEQRIVLDLVAEALQERNRANGYLSEMTGEVSIPDELDSKMSGCPTDKQTAPEATAV